VYKPEVESLKELRKKVWEEDGPEDQPIDQRIEWYEDWNYPSIHKA
jgi:hypothetical protein